MITNLSHTPVIHVKNKNFILVEQKNADYILETNL